MSAAGSAAPRAVVFAYGEVGAACLEGLLDQGVPIPLVVTHEDDPGERCWFRSVRKLAESAGIAAIAPEDANTPEVRERVAAAEPDFLFSFYFRRILRRPLLELPRRGALNLHGSLLPRYRGRCPANWVLIAGESVTGVTLHHMDEKADHGDVVAQRCVPVDRDDGALELTRKLASAGRALMRDTWPALARGSAPRVPQDHARATTFGGRRPEDGRIDWRQPAERIRNLVRAVSDPWPGAFGELRSRRLMVWWAETLPCPSGLRPGEIFFDASRTPCVAAGDGALQLSRVGWAGEPAAESGSWAAREGLRAGERFGDFERDGPIT